MASAKSIETEDDQTLTTSHGMPSLFISLNISRAVLGCLACTLTAMREFMQYVFGLRPASFIIWTACGAEKDGRRTSQKKNQPLLSRKSLNAIVTNQLTQQI